MSKVNDWLNRSILDTFGGGEEKKGDIGIEIEVEGRGLPREFEYYWLVHADGSLRGAENAEYVLKRPMQRATIPKALKNLKSAIDKSKCTIEWSTRCSVHVHHNVQNLTNRQILTLLTVYYIFEDVLSQHIAPDRCGNNFCLRLSDAEIIVDNLMNCITTANWSQAGHENNRYAACNLAALAKFGSLEFRVMGGTVEPKPIQEWVDIICRLVDESKKFNDPAEVIQAFSGDGPERFMNRIFPDHARVLGRVPKWQDKMWAGMRLIQNVAFARPSWKDDPAKKKESAEFNDAPVGRAAAAAEAEMERILRRQQQRQEQADLERRLGLR